MYVTFKDVPVTVTVDTEVEVDLDIDEIMGQLTDDQLKAELRARDEDYRTIGDIEALDTLQSAADMFRAQGKPAMAMRIEQLIEDLQL